MSDLWKPNVTVAAVIERAGRFLLVEEQTRDGLRLNQPAGHLEPGESLINACVRETLEETAHAFMPEFLLGTYLWRSENHVTYLRFAFGGNVGEHIAGRALDTGILRAVWLTRDEITARAPEHRSPLVMKCVEDFLAGQRFALDSVYAHETALGCSARADRHLAPLSSATLDSRLRGVNTVAAPSATSTATRAL